MVTVHHTAMNIALCVIIILPKIFLLPILSLLRLKSIASTFLFSFSQPSSRITATSLLYAVRPLFHNIPHNNVAVRYDTHCLRMRYVMLQLSHKALHNADGGLCISDTLP